MRAIVEFLPEGLLRVECNGKTYTNLTEAHFRMEGPLPMMDLSHALGELEPVREQPASLPTLDCPPED